ncbi:MAG: ABC transporter permease [Gemmatimonadales bacterium]|nr:MAG: ABC transporter permease [Gemmatimonadales bacterium]
MRRLLIRRLLGTVPLVLGVASLIFVALHLAPGDPVDVYSGPGVAPEVLDGLRERLGLDDPLPVRYVRWMGATLTGDLGHSIARGQPVRDVILDRLPNTLLLSGVALALAFGLGVTIGAVQAVRQDSVTDRVLTVVTLFFHSMPSFWLALMMILVFALWARTAWGWPIHFPASGMTSVGHEAMSGPQQLLDRLRHLVLPATTLALVLAGGIARHTRSSVLEVIRQDWVRTALARGLSRSRVLATHALPAALPPVITLLGLYVPALMGGAVFVEIVFGWPGMGKLMIDAIAQRDHPVVLAASLLFALLVVLGNLLADVLHALLDPRVRQEESR